VREDESIAQPYRVFWPRKRAIGDLRSRFQRRIANIHATRLATASTTLVIRSGGAKAAQYSSASDNRRSAVVDRKSDCRSSTPWARHCALIFCLFVAATATLAQSEPITEPKVAPRAAWGALPPKTDLMQEQKPSEIIIHHTGERQQPRISLEVKLRGLQGFAMAPGKVGSLSKPAWGDVPYHYYIDASGRIGEGRDPGFQGDGVTAFSNEDRIQIVVEGDFKREEPTKAELESLKTLVVWLALKYGISPENIAGHGDYDQTDCPGANLKSFMEELREVVRAQVFLGK
jgi:hypothetical protein